MAPSPLTAPAAPLLPTPSDPAAAFERLLARARAMGDVEALADLAAVGLELGQARAASHALALLDGLEVVVWEADAASGEFTYVNRRAETMLGHPLARWFEPGWFWHELVHRDDRERAYTQCVESTARCEDHTIYYRVRDAAGGVRWLEDVVRVEPDADGRPGRISGVLLDVTARVVAEEAARASEERLRLLAESVRDLVCLHGRDGRYVYVTPSARTLLGYEPDELLGHDPFEFVHADDAPRLRRGLGRVRHGETPAAMEYRYRSADGSYRWMETLAQPLTDTNGRVSRILTSSRDVTERVIGEQALRASDERYRTVARTTSDLLYEWSMADGAITWSDGLRDAFGYDASRPHSLSWWEAQIHPDDRARVDASLADALQRGAEVWTAEYRFRHAKGHWASVLDRGHLVRDGDGRAVRMIGAMTDVTHRQLLEERLRQAQKMEAIGRLAGGVAHDFNNVLTAIRSYSELVLDELAASGPSHLRSDVEEIRRAAERAAALTRQLLAFGRKEVLRPQPLDVAAVVVGLEPMLRRLTPASIALDLARPAGPAWVRADAAQLEQVVVNLAVNACDAMPDGGTLHVTIETGVRRPAADGAGAAGDADAGWMVLRVGDTGVGMDDETRARIFEPFFTTKPVGKGTGLGLATVYGIVQQHHGVVEVQSAPGDGTTFSVWLPHIVPPGAASPAPGAAETARGGSETVLVVEDEDAVRASVRRILERQGYRVLEARSGTDALRVLTSHAAPVDLVLTDVVMPEMGGRELATRLGTSHPATKVVFMSGYTDDVRLRADLAQRDGTALVQKPFAAVELVRAVRAALG